MQEWELLLQLLMARFESEKEEVTPDLYNFKSIDNRYYVIDGVDVGSNMRKLNASSMSMFSYNMRDLKEDCFASVQRNFIDNRVMLISRWENAGCCIEAQRLFVRQIINYACSFKLRKVQMEFEKSEYNPEVEAALDYNSFTQAIWFNERICRHLDINADDFVLFDNSILIERFKYHDATLQYEYCYQSRYCTIVRLRRYKYILAEIKVDSRYEGKVKSVAVGGRYNSEFFIFPLSFFAVIAAINRGCTILELTWDNTNWETVQLVVNALEKLGAIKQTQRMAIMLDLSLPHLQYLIAKAKSI